MRLVVFYLLHFGYVPFQYIRGCFIYHLKQILTEDPRRMIILRRYEDIQTICKMSLDVNSHTFSKFKLTTGYICVCIDIAIFLSVTIFIMSKKARYTIDKLRKAHFGSVCI